MVKAKKREPLVVGQRVWIETISYFFREPRSIVEYEVIEANRNSAYVVRVGGLEKYKADPIKEKWSKTRVEQKTYDVKNSMAGYGYRLWLTKEDFERNVQYNKEVKELRAKAIQLVNQMNVNELRKVLEI